MRLWMTGLATTALALPLHAADNPLDPQPQRPAKNPLDTGDGPTQRGQNPLDASDAKDDTAPADTGAEDDFDTAWNKAIGGDTKGEKAPAGEKKAVKKDPFVYPYQIKEVRDVAMNVTAYAFKAPVGWKLTGSVIWTGGAYAAPEVAMSVTGKKGEVYRIEAPRSLVHTLTNPDFIRDLDEKGIPHNQEPETGVAAPEADGLGQWIVDHGSELWPDRKNIELVDQKRDEKAEEAMPIDNMTKMVGVVTIDYELDGVAYRAMLFPTAAVFDAVEGPTGSMQAWTLYIERSYEAPKAIFEQTLPTFEAMTQSVVAEPNWATQRNQVTQEIMNARAANPDNLDWARSIPNALASRGQQIRAANAQWLEAEKQKLAQPANQNAPGK